MSILSFETKKDKKNRKGDSESKTIKKQGCLEKAIAALELALAQKIDVNTSFADYEGSLLELCNEASRLIIQRRLEMVSEQYSCDNLMIDGVLYKRHELGAVDYHSLCGSMTIERYTYRRADIRNGPTVVPLELSAELMEKATPALAYRAALGAAQCPSRQWEAQLRASHRRPPSRSTLERMSKKIGDIVKTATPAILPVVREAEAHHTDAVALSIGLDRTTIPMEEKVHPHTWEKEPGARRRKRPYVRKPPAPVVVNYRMGYVGTVSIIGIDGQSIQTNKYGCSADADPNDILQGMSDDLIHIQNKRQAAGLPLLPMGIVQDGAPEMWNLVEPAIKRAFPGQRYEKCIDRFHLMERLAESLKALKDPVLFREVQLNEWRQALEKDDKSIDRIEKFILQHRNRLRRKKRLTVANAEILRSHLVYIKNNKKYMRYASLRKKGIPSGSGATEGACKSLIMVRTKGCGQRWHARGVNAVLALRGLYLSDRLMPFWEALYKSKESFVSEAV